MKILENIDNYVIRVNAVVNEKKINGETLNEVRILEKILQSLALKFYYVVVVIDGSKDLSQIFIDEFIGP